MKKSSRNMKLVITSVMIASLLISNSFVFAKKIDNRTKALFIGTDDNIVEAIADVNISTVDLNNTNDDDKLSEDSDNQYTVVKASALNKKSKLSTSAKEKLKNDYKNGKVITVFGDSKELGDGSSLYEYVGEKAEILLDDVNDPSNKRNGKLAAITLYKDSNDKPAMNALYIFNDGLELANKLNELEPIVEKMEKDSVSKEKIKEYVDMQLKSVNTKQKPVTDEEKCKEISKNYIRIKTKIKQIANTQPTGVSAQQLAVDSEPPTFTVTIVSSGWGSFVEQIGGKRVYISGTTKRWAVIGSVQPTPDWSSNNVVTSIVYPRFGNWSQNGSFNGQAIWGAYPITTPENAGSQSYTYSLSASGALTSGGQFEGGVSGGISWTTSFDNISVSMIQNSKGQNFQNIAEWKYDYTLANPRGSNPYFFATSSAKYTSDVSPSIILENTQSYNARCRFGETIVWYKSSVSPFLATTQTSDYGYSYYTLPRA